MEAPERTTRRNDIDRLRVLACISTFCYHPLTVFDLGVFSHIKSSTTSATFDIASRLLHTVRMPLFFLIAGMVGLISIRRLTDRQIIRQRIQRLLLPFLVGVILFAPGIKYFEILDGRHISFQGVTAWTGPPPAPQDFLRRFFTQPKWFSWSHMWFLLYLFILGSALLPALRRLDRAQWLPRLYVPLVLLGSLACLVAVEIALRPVFPWHIPNLIWDWANVAVYVICMLAGAALIRFPAIEVVLQRCLPVTAVLACLGIFLYLGSDSWPATGIGRALTLWAALGLAIGLGPVLSRGNFAGERYLSEAVLPLYVLHLLPLVVIAFYVKDLSWPIWLRYAVMVLGGFATTLAMYHFFVRPFDVARLALGLPRRS